MNSKKINTKTTFPALILNFLYLLYVNSEIKEQAKENTQKMMGMMYSMALPSARVNIILRIIKFN